MRLLPNALATVLAACALPAFAQSPARCDMDVLLDELDRGARIETLRENGRLDMAQQVATAMGQVGPVVSFVDALTGGTYNTEVDYILRERLIETRINANGSLSDRYRSHLARVQTQRPLTVNIAEGMDRLSLLASGYTIGRLVSDGLAGDDSAKLQAIAEVVKVQQGRAIASIGSRSLNVAMGGVAVLDYALNAFISEAFSREERLYWDAFNAWHNQLDRERGMMRWARAADSGTDALQRELHGFMAEDFAEFADVEAATLAQGPTQSIARLSERDRRDMRQRFAGRWYKESVEPFLQNYYARQATSANDEIVDELFDECSELGAFIADMTQLQGLIAEARAEMEQTAVASNQAPAMCTIPAGAARNYGMDAMSEEEKAQGEAALALVRQSATEAMSIDGITGSQRQLLEKISTATPGGFLTDQVNLASIQPDTATRAREAGSVYLMLPQELRNYVYVGKPDGMLGQFRRAVIPFGEGLMLNGIRNAGGRFAEIGEVMPGQQVPMGSVVLAPDVTAFSFRYRSARLGTRYIFEGTTSLRMDAWINCEPTFSRSFDRTLESEQFVMGFEFDTSVFPKAIASVLIPFIDEMYTVTLDEILGSAAYASAAAASVPQPMAAQPVNAPSQGTQSAAERLRQLDALLEQGLITQDEYADRRQRVLDSL